MVRKLKKCKKCGVEKELSEFTAHKTTKDKVNSQCRECDNARKRQEWKNKTEEEKKRFSRKCVLSVYGLSEEDYLKLLTDQNHKCAICGKDETVVPKKRLFVDHCHESGKVRGLLCHHCNAALGHMYDSTKNLLKAVDYLLEANNGF